MTIYLIRHGQDDEAVRGGWSQSSLSPEGIRQAQELANKVYALRKTMKISRVFASDLPRALETAQPIANLLQLEEELLPEFREMNNGSLAGMPNEEADRDYPSFHWSQMDWDEPYPQGESPHEFYERIKKAWRDFIRLNSQKNVILVSHAGVMRIIFALVREEDFTNKSKRMDFPCAQIFTLELGENDA